MFDCAVNKSRILKNKVLNARQFLQRLHDLIPRNVIRGSQYPCQLRKNDRGNIALFTSLFRVSDQPRRSLCLNKIVAHEMPDKDVCVERDHLRLNFFRSAFPTALSISSVDNS